MAITLFRHNSQAYLAAAEMLQKTGRAAVIHPTGTGKSFIGFKLCEDHPESRICWLAPSEYIFRTQTENLKEATGIELPENVRFFTYAKLTCLTEEERKAIKPDFIVLDEFHRCGAAVWGEGVRKLLEEFSEAKVLGLSATAIRYLDSQRDMSDELFDGNVASEMSLGEAIVRGILKAPRYVLSVYSWQESLRSYETRIARLRGNASRARAEKLLEELRRALSHAEGLDEIFEKHVIDRAGKYLLFCADYKHLQVCAAKAKEWFRRIDAAPHVYSIYSEDLTSAEQFRRFRQDEDPAHLKLLFCIDAMNEGIHLEGISGVVLLRPTVSPVVYKQQIGRALSASKKTDPVIFDLVNNIQHLYVIDSVREEMEEAVNYFQRSGRENQVTWKDFRITDELRECLELFRTLEQSLTASWEANYLEAKNYFETCGNLLVPLDYLTESGCRLGRWIAAQRAAGKPGNKNGKKNLSKERIRKLDAIGMCWENADERAWNRSLEAAKRYRAEHGNLDVPTEYATQEGIGLGRWLRNAREKYREGSLSEERIRDLELLDVHWEAITSRKWNGYLELARQYAKEHGNLTVPKAYVTPEGVKLGIWICSQRDSYGKGRLSREQIKSLEELGMSWDRSESKWEKGFRYCKRYVEEHGDINTIAEDFQYGDFRPLPWLRAQRSRYAGGKLSDDRVARLETLGIHWRQQDAMWDRGFAHAAEFTREHGDLKVPTGYECRDGFKLKIWLNNQIARHKQGKMSEEQRKRLEEIGIKWR